MLATFGFLSGGAANTARTQAFLTATGITDATSISALNAMDTSLISAGLLPSGTGAGKIKALYPIVGGTAATHKFNFVDPRDLDAAFRLQFNGGWTHSTNGALPNGTNAYADTFLNASSNLSVSSLSFGGYTSSTENRLADSYHGASPNAYLMHSFKTYSFTEYWRPNGAAINLTGGTTGMVQANQLDSLSKIYSNNSIGASGVFAITSLPNLNMYIGGVNNNGTAAFFDNHIISYYYYADGLTDTQASNHYTAIQTFQTTLGRAV